MEVAHLGCGAHYQGIHQADLCDEILLRKAVAQVDIPNLLQHLNTPCSQFLRHQDGGTSIGSNSSNCSTVIVPTYSMCTGEQTQGKASKSYFTKLHLYKRMKQVFFAIVKQDVMTRVSPFELHAYRSSVLHGRDQPSDCARYHFGIRQPGIHRMILHSFTSTGKTNKANCSPAWSTEPSCCGRGGDGLHDARF